jgi:hypothetical protein
MKKFFRFTLNAVIVAGSGAAFNAVPYAYFDVISTYQAVAVITIGFGIAAAASFVKSKI